MFREPLAFLRCFRHPTLALAALLLSLAWTAAAQTNELSGTNSPPDESRCTVMLANRQICTFRATLDGYSPEERAAAASARLESVLAQAKTILVTTQAVAQGVQLRLDGRSLFVVTPDDVFSLRGQTVDAKAGAVAAALREALQDYHGLDTPWEVARAVGRALLGLVYFGLLFWAVRRAKSWLLQRSTQLAADKTKRMQVRGLRTAGLRSFVSVLRAVLNFGSYALIALLVTALVWYELRCFPYSRPWGDTLREHASAQLAALGAGVLDALPNLVVVVLIGLVFRMVIQVVSRLFAPAEKGEFQTRLVDPLVAATTRRLLIWLVCAVGVVVAYPYIPGSESPAFKGVTVFAGVVLSLGSSNLINQIASGLVLIYSRTCRVGDYVRVGETEGTVLDIGLCVTHIRTVRNEEVHLANSSLLGTATTNYSRLARTEGVFLTAQVTISYSTPWRQVHGLLLEAAKRTEGLLSTPTPFVLQTALSDFYVEYQLNVRIEKPERRVWVQSDLHGHIQDVFNEYGVQIMSPHYLTDPPSAHLVPRSKWFLAPAAEPHNGESSLRPSSTTPSAPLPGTDGPAEG